MKVVDGGDGGGDQFVRMLVIDAHNRHVTDQLSLTARQVFHVLTGPARSYEEPKKKIIFLLCYLRVFSEFGKKKAMSKKKIKVFSCVVSKVFGGWTPICERDLGPISPVDLSSGRNCALTLRRESTLRTQTPRVLCATTQPKSGLILI